MTDRNIRFEKVFVGYRGKIYCFSICQCFVSVTDSMLSYKCKSLSSPVETNKDMNNDAKETVVCYNYYYTGKLQCEKWRYVNQVTREKERERDGNKISIGHMSRVEWLRYVTYVYTETAVCV